MKSEEIKINIEEINTRSIIAYFISSDYKSETKISTYFNKNFKIGEKIINVLGIGKFEEGNCIIVGNVANLVVKDKYWHKSQYNNIKLSLEKMKQKIKKRIEMKEIYIFVEGLISDYRLEELKEMIDDVFIDLNNEVYIVKDFY